MMTTCYVPQPYTRADTKKCWVVYPNGSFNDFENLVDAIRPRLDEWSHTSPSVEKLVVRIASFGGTTETLEAVKARLGACELIKTDQHLMWELHWTSKSQLYKLKK